MTSLLDAPELIEIHDLNIEKPRARGAQPGFWRTLARGITKHLTHTPRVRQAPSCNRHRPFEAPMDRFTREYSSLAIYALAII